MKKEKIKKFLLDLFFPIECIFCHKGDVWVCPDCLSSIEISSLQKCPFCEKETVDSGRVCGPCRRKLALEEDKPPLDALISATDYQSVSKMVGLLKYRFARELAEPLAKLLKKTCLKNDLPLPDLIIPVPLHKRRLRWRGFNQAGLLASFLAENLSPGLPIPLREDLTERKKFTPPQMKIKNYRERKNNLRNAFGKNKKLPEGEFREAIAGKKILLVDDVSTTGSTLFELGKFLKKSGAGEIFAVVLARQNPEDSKKDNF